MSMFGKKSSQRGRSLSNPGSKYRDKPGKTGTKDKDQPRPTYATPTASSQAKTATKTPKEEKGKKKGADKEKKKGFHLPGFGKKTSERKSSASDVSSPSSSLPSTSPLAYSQDSLPHEDYSLPSGVSASVTGATAVVLPSLEQIEHSGTSEEEGYGKSFALGHRVQSFESDDGAKEGLKERVQILELEVTRQKEINAGHGKERDKLERTLSKEFTSAKVDYEMQLRSSEASLAMERKAIEQLKKEREELRAQLREEKRRREVVEKIPLSSAVSKGPKEDEVEQQAERHKQEIQQLSSDQTALSDRLQSEATTQMRLHESSHAAQSQKELQRLRAELQETHEKLAELSTDKTELDKQLQHAVIARQKAEATSQELALSKTAQKDSEHMLLEKEREWQSKLEKQKEILRESKENHRRQLEEKERESRQVMLTQKRQQEEKERENQRGFEARMKAREEEFERILEQQRKDQQNASEIQQAQVQRKHAKALEQKEEEKHAAAHEAEMKIREMEQRAEEESRQLVTQRERELTRRIADLEARLHAQNAEIGERDRVISHYAQEHGASNITPANVHGEQELHSNVVELAKALAGVVDADNISVYFKTERPLSLQEVRNVFHILGFPPHSQMPKAQSYILAVLPAPNSKDSLLMDFSGMFRDRDEGMHSLASSEFEAIADDDRDNMSFLTTQQSMDDANNLNLSLPEPLTGGAAQQRLQSLEQLHHEKSRALEGTVEHIRKLELKIAEAGDEIEKLEEELRRVREQAALVEREQTEKLAELEARARDTQVIDEQLTQAATNASLKDEEIASLKEKAGELETLLRVHASSETIDEKVQNLQAIVESLLPYRDNTYELDRKLESAKSQAKDMSQMVQLLTSKLQEKETKLATALRGTEDLHRQLTEKEQQIEEATDQEKALLAKIAELTETARLAETEKQTSDLRPPLAENMHGESPVPTTEELSSTLHALELENDNLKMQIQSLSGRMEELQKLRVQFQLQGKELFAFKQKHEAVEAEKAEVLKELEHCKTTMEVLQLRLSEAEIIQKTHGDQESATADVSEAEQGLAKLSAGHDAIKLKMEIGHWQSEVKQKEAKARTLEAELHTVQAENDQKIAQLQRALSEAENSKQEISHQLHELGNELELKKKTLIELQAHNEDLENKVSHLPYLEEDVERYRSKAEAQEQEVKDMKHQVMTLEKLNAEQKADLDAASAQVDLFKEDFVTERRDRESAMGRIDTERADLEYKLQQARDDITKKFQGEAELLRSQVASAQKECCEFAEKLDFAKAETLKTKEELNHLKQQHHLTVTQFNGLHAKLEKSIADTARLNDEVLLKNQQLKQYKKQSDTFKVQLESLQKTQANSEQLQILAATSDSHRIAMEKQMETLRAEKDVMERELKELQSRRMNESHFSSAFQREFTRREEYQTRYMELADKFDRIFQENDHMRLLLQQHGISFQPLPPPTGHPSESAGGGMITRSPEEQYKLPLGQGGSPSPMPPMPSSPQQQRRATGHYQQSPPTVRSHVVQPHPQTNVSHGAFQPFTQAAAPSQIQDRERQRMSQYEQQQVLERQQIAEQRKQREMMEKQKQGEMLSQQQQRERMEGIRRQSNAAYEQHQLQQVLRKEPGRRHARDKVLSADEPQLKNRPIVATMWPPRPGINAKPGIPPSVGEIRPPVHMASGYPQTSAASQYYPPSVHSPAVVAPNINTTVSQYSTPPPHPPHPAGPGSVGISVPPVMSQIPIPKDHPQQMQPHSHPPVMLDSPPFPAHGIQTNATVPPPAVLPQQYPLPSQVPPQLYGDHRQSSDPPHVVPSQQHPPTIHPTASGKTPRTNASQIPRHPQQLPPATAGSNIAIPQGRIPVAGSNRATPQSNIPVAGSNVAIPQGRIPVAGSNVATSQGRIPVAGSNRATPQNNIPVAGSNRATSQGRIPLAANPAGAATKGRIPPETVREEGEGGPVSMPIQESHPDLPQQKVKGEDKKGKMKSGDASAQDDSLMKEIDCDIKVAAMEVEANVEAANEHSITSQEEVPYDPNLVCPTCNRNYRIGEIQKFRKHVAACADSRTVYK